MKCPPCHGDCSQGRRCPAENHPAYESWVEWVKKTGAGISLNRFVFTRSSHGQAFRSGWDARNKTGEDEWKKHTNDQA